MFAYTLTRARNLGNVSSHASWSAITSSRGASLRLGSAPSVMSGAWDQTRLREGPGRGSYLCPSLFHISSTDDVQGNVTFDREHMTTGPEAPCTHYSLALSQKANIFSCGLIFLEVQLIPSLNNPKRNSPANNINS